MPCLSYPASLVYQNEIPIDLSRKSTQLALIMSFSNMKMLTDMAYLQYHPSEIMPYQSYPESLANQNEIPIDLSC